MPAITFLNAIFGLYLFILIFAPLAYGSVDYWALATVETGAALGLLLWVIYHTRSGKPLIWVPGLLPLLLMLGWLIFQLVPLPAGWVALISPATHTVYQESVGVVRPVRWIPLTLSPEGTLEELLRLGGYICFYIFSVQLLLEKKRLKLTVIFVVVYTAILSFVAVLQHFNSNGRVLWIREIYEGSFFGPYINGNHMAGWLVLVLPMVVAMFLFFRPPIRYGSLRETLVALFTHPKLNTYALVGFSGLIGIVALFLSLARGGIISGCVSFGLLGLAVMKLNGRWRRGTSMMVAGVVIILSVGWFGWQPIVGEFGKLASEEARMNMLRPVIWQDSLRIVADYPVFGTGLGSFLDIYPSYQSFSDSRLFREAHNDYLEFLVTGGIPFIVLMGWFIVSIVTQSYRYFRLRNEPYCRFLYLGAGAGIVGIGLHSFVEFNFQIGANTLYFFFLVSLLVAAAHTRLRATHRPVSLKALPLKMNYAAAVLSGALFLGATGYALGIGLADSFYSVSPDTVYKDEITIEEHDQVQRFLSSASYFAPLKNHYPFLLADAAAKAGLMQLAESQYQTALLLRPTYALTMQEFGHLLEALGRSDQAEQLFKVAIRRDVQSPYGYEAYADWLISKGRDEEGVDQMRMAIERDHTHTRDYIDNLSYWGLQSKEIAPAVPNLAGSCLAMAEYCQENMDDDIAEEFYSRALWAESRSKEPHARTFQQIYRYYFKKEDWQAALGVMQKAVKRLPDNAGLRISSARVYEKMGITYRAAQEYQKALLLKPGNKAAQTGLVRLEEQW
jgi:Tfp pilus assembly protein PilF/O-antigen ligase